MPREKAHLGGHDDVHHTGTGCHWGRTPAVASAAVSQVVNPAGPGPLVAPPVDPTVATTLYAATEFLPIRAAVLRGQVKDRDGQPIPGVTITVLGHPEFGTTTTRTDGMLD